MYQKKKTPRPSTANADGTRSVMVEVRPALARGSDSARPPLPAGVTVDDDYEPVPMAGGTEIIRCRVRSDADVDALKRQPGVVAVWNDTPIEPMTPR